VFTRLIAIAGAITLVASPVMATAQVLPAPQQEVVSGDNQLVARRRFPLFWIPVTAAVLAALALWLVLDEFGWCWTRTTHRLAPERGARRTDCSTRHVRGGGCPAILIAYPNWLSERAPHSKPA